MAHNLMRTAATIIGVATARVRALTLRARIITIPARLANHSRVLTLHLPTDWKWADDFARLWHAVLGPSPPAANT